MKKHAHISIFITSTFVMAVIAVLLVLMPKNTTAKVHDTLQRNVIIRGVVLNEKKKPMPGAVVTFYENKKCIGNEITDKNGHINYKVNEVGFINYDYEVEITHPGYDKYRILIPYLHTSVKFKVRMKVGSNVSDEWDELFLIIPSCSPLKSEKERSKVSFNLASILTFIDAFEPTKRTITSETIEQCDSMKQSKPIQLSIPQPCHED